MCVFPNLSRSVGGYENHQNARAHFSRRGIVIHLLIFHFFFKSHDWSLRKVFSYKGKASLRLVRAKQRHGVSASTKKYTVASLPLSSPVTTQ